MRYAKVLLLLIVMTSAQMGIMAQDSLYTLEQCIDLTLQNSKQLKNAQNETESAVYLRKEAFTKYFPEVSGVGLFFWANHDIIQYNVLDLIELGILNKGKTVGVQLMQPVFTGGQIYHGNKLAEVGEEVARIRQSQTQNDLRLATESIFWKLATLKATKTALVSAITTLDTLENQVSVAVDAGIAMRNDLLKVQLKRNTYRTEMIDLDNGILLVKMLLGQYMGLGTNGNLDIVSSVPTQVPQFPIELFVNPEEALGGTPDFQLLEKNIQAKELERKMEFGKYLPSVALGAGWYYHDLFHQNHNFGAIQIGFVIPMSEWWGGSYALKRKTIALTKAVNDRDDLSQKLVIQMQDKWNNLTAAHRKMEIEAEGITESLENRRLSAMYYEAGMSTITDLLEAEAMLKLSQEKYINAYGAFRTAQAAYLIATNR